jgi:hypothetical protein
MGMELPAKKYGRRREEYRYSRVIVDSASLLYAPASVIIGLGAVTQEAGSSVPGMVAAFRAVFFCFEHAATRRPPVVSSIQICALPWHAAVLCSHDDLLPERLDRA